MERKAGFTQIPKKRAVGFALGGEKKEAGFISCKMEKQWCVSEMPENTDEPITIHTLYKTNIPVAVTLSAVRSKVMALCEGFLAGAVPFKEIKFIRECSEGIWEFEIVTDHEINQMSVATVDTDGIESVAESETSNEEPLSQDDLLAQSWRTMLAMEKTAYHFLNDVERGREYLGEVKDFAEENGMVIIFGYSDDVMVVRGAINETFGAFKGTTVYFAPDGRVLTADENEEDRSETKTLPFVKAVKGTMVDGEDVMWNFETSLPCKRFHVMDDGELFCVGIVISLFHIQNPTIR